MSCPRCNSDAFDSDCGDSYHRPIKEREQQGTPSLYDLLGLTAWQPPKGADAVLDRTALLLVELDPQRAGARVTAERLLDDIRPRIAAEAAEGAIALFREYRDRHGHPEEQAATLAVAEVVEGMGAGDTRGGGLWLSD